MANSATAIENGVVDFLEKDNAMNVPMSNVHYLSTLRSLPIMISLLCCSGLSHGQGTIGRTNIPFQGIASGGTLVLGYSDGGRNANFVTIGTSAGEPAESVVRHLAEAIASSDVIFDYSRLRRRVDRNALAVRMARGTTLQIAGGTDFFLAGSETGLGIPRPVLSLSCSYDEQANTIRLGWANPPGEYGKNDCLKLRWRYANSDKGGSVSFLGPTIPTSYAIKNLADLNDLNVSLACFRHDAAVGALVAKGIPLYESAIPSNLATIRVTGTGSCQEELNGIPFFAGIAPNWSLWSTASEVDRTAFGQGNKYDLGPRLPWDYPKALSTKPFYQMIKAPGKGGTHGVYRKFPGVIPGHTYRLTACLSTLDMDSARGEWSFSVHAAPTRGRDLTAEQFAGRAALPDRRSGAEAAQIAFFGPGRTTRCRFDSAISGYSRLKDGTPSSNITVPPDANEITVWVRFNCSDPDGEVALSGVKLEELTTTKDHKAPREIAQEEVKHEIDLLKWMEKTRK